MQRRRRAVPSTIQPPLRSSAPLLLRSRESTAEVTLEPPPQPMPETQRQRLVARRRRILVTGASGMLGSDLLPALAAWGHDVVGRSHAELDVSDPDAIAAEFEKRRPEVVVNCAAFTKVDACESDARAVAVNDEGVANLARACERAAAQLVQLSTDFVFDGKKRQPYREEDPAEPLSAYGRTKRAGELRALELDDALVVRTSWLFGSGGRNFVEAILQQVEQGKSELKVVHDQVGRPTATTDLAEAIVALIAIQAIGVVHFANRGEVSWYEFAREILRLSGFDTVRLLRISSDELGRTARRPTYSVLDTTRYELLTQKPIRDFRGPLVEYLRRRGRVEA